MNRAEVGGRHIVLQKVEKTEEVSWNTSVMMPICANVNPKLSFKTGYMAGITDWIISFNRWQKPMANNIV